MHRSILKVLTVFCTLVILLINGFFFSFSQFYEGIIFWEHFIGISLVAYIFGYSLVFKIWALKKTYYIFYAFPYVAFVFLKVVFYVMY